MDGCNSMYQIKYNFFQFVKLFLMLFFFLQVCSTLKLCCTYSWKKGKKRKRKTIFYALSSHRFADSKKKRFANSCGWLTMQLAFCCKVYWVLIIYVVGGIIYPLLRDILHSATLPSILLVEVLKEGLYSQVTIGMVGSCILLREFISRSPKVCFTLIAHG